MRKPMSATELRKDIYRVLDEVLETGIPQEVRRGQKRLMIVAADGPQRPRLRLDALPRRQAIACTPDDLIATTWEGEWKGEL
jgi:hypothetical protein